MVEKLTTNVPYNAKVTCLSAMGGNGWCQKEAKPWLAQAIEAAGQAFSGINLCLAALFQHY